MPSIATTVLTDRTTPTAVAHSFVPSDIAQPGSVGILFESGGVLANANKLTVSSRKTAAGKLKGKVTLAMPIVETLNGVPTVTRTGFVSLETTFDLRSTLAERNNIIGMMADALSSGKTLINDTIVKGESVF